MKRFAALSTLLAAFVFAVPATAQVYDDYGYDEYEYFEDDAGYGYYGDEGVHGYFYDDESEWMQDDFGYYDSDFDYDTDEGWFSDWYGESDGWFESF